MFLVRPRRLCTPLKIRCLLSLQPRSLALRLHLCMSLRRRRRRLVRLERVLRIRSGLATETETKSHLIRLESPRLTSLPNKSATLLTRPSHPTTLSKLQQCRRLQVRRLLSPRNERAPQIRLSMLLQPNSLLWMNLPLPRATDSLTMRQTAQNCLHVCWKSSMTTLTAKPKLKGRTSLAPAGTDLTKDKEEDNTLKDTSVPSVKDVAVAAALPADVKLAETTPFATTSAPSAELFDDAFGIKSSGEKDKSAATSNGFDDAFGAEACDY